MIEMTAADKRLLHLVEELTGEAWCPYPSIKFMRIMLCESVDKESKLKLIENRRKFYFPDFNRGVDPQDKELEELAKQYNVDITPEALIIWFKNEEIFWQIRN